MTSKITPSIRWGIIGCGAVTELKSGPAYQLTKGFELIEVMRRNLELAEDYARRHQVPRFTNNADALIEHPDIDAIYIATPPDSHKDYALKVASAGKICCIEKPIAPSYDDAEAIVSAFDKAQLPLFVAYYRRSLPRFNHVKMLLDKGQIGTPRHISWHLSKPANNLDRSGEYNWRTDSNIAKGGYFDDLASHGLDLFAYLLGDYAEVKGFANNQQGLYSAFDAVTACWRHTNGVTGSGSWNFGGATREDEVRIYGSKGDIRFSVFDEQDIVLTTESAQENIWVENPKHIQQHHVENILRQLTNGIVHPSTGVSAAHTSWVMDQILRQQ